MSDEISFAFEPVEGDTRVIMISEGETGGFFGLADSIVVRMGQRGMETDLANLKDILEAQA